MQSLFNPIPKHTARQVTRSAAALGAETEVENYKIMHVPYLTQPTYINK